MTKRVSLFEILQRIPEPLSLDCCNWFRKTAGMLRGIEEDRLKMASEQRTDYRYHRSEIIYIGCDGFARYSERVFYLDTYRGSVREGRMNQKW